MGASAPPGEPGGSLFGALPEAIAQRAKPTVIVVKTREADRPPDVRAAGPEGRDARRGGPRGGGVARDPGPGGPLVRGGELPPLGVRRPRPARVAQGEAGADGRARPADAQRGRDHRPDRPARRARDAGALPDPRRDPGHRLRVRRRDPRDRRGRGRAGRPAPRRAAALRLVPGQGRGALEVAVRDVGRHRRLGGHRRPQLAPPDGLRDARAAARGAAAAVRQGLLPAPDRRGRRAQGRAAAAGSPSSSRGR